MILKQETLEKLKKHLPYGARVRVANKLGTARAVVTKVLQGKLHNQLALSVLEELLEEVKVNKVTMTSKVAELTETIESL